MISKIHNFNPFQSSSSLPIRAYFCQLVFAVLLVSSFFKCFERLFLFHSILVAGPTQCYSFVKIRDTASLELRNGLLFFRFLLTFRNMT